MPRPRSTSVISACVILAGSYFPRTNLCTLLCGVRSVLGPPSCLPDVHVSTAICGLVWCVLNVAFTGIRTMVFAAFWLRKDRSKFSKGRFTRGSGTRCAAPAAEKSADFCTNSTSLSFLRKSSSKRPGNWHHPFSQKGGLCLSLHLETHAAAWVDLDGPWKRAYRSGPQKRARQVSKSLI